MGTTDIHICVIIQMTLNNMKCLYSLFISTVYEVNQRKKNGCLNPC